MAAPASNPKPTTVAATVATFGVDLRSLGQTPGKAGVFVGVVRCECSGRFGRPQKQNARAMVSSGGCGDISLTMSYFHTGTRTIIGAEAFHFPVRDGKEWDHLAMVIRLNWLPGCPHEQLSQIMEFESVL